MDATFDLALNLAPVQGEVSADRVGLDQTRFQRIMDSLPDARYARALAVGASPVFCRKLATVCDALATSVDITRIRGGGLDLMVVCDTLAVTDPDAFPTLANQLVNTLKPGGHLVLLHWLDGDAAAAAFIHAAGPSLLPLSRQRTPHYRLDVLERA